jgi:hypothetical protein
MEGAARVRTQNSYIDLVSFHAGNIGARPPGFGPPVEPDEGPRGKTRQSPRRCQIVVVSAAWFSV